MRHNFYARRLAIFGMLFGFTTMAAAQNITPKSATASDNAVGRALEAPINTLPAQEKFWWDDDWYDDGKLQVPQNFDVVTRSVSYKSSADDTDVPALLMRPKKPGHYPGVIFQHGRRGLDEFTKKLARRMAARGFIVLAPDVYTARFIEKLPIAHMRETEGDVDAAVEFLLKQPDVSTTRVCLYSHTRGGYYTLRVAVTMKRQDKHLACYVSFYPHWQDPNAAEPSQVYRYATEADQLTIPVMIFMGEFEQYQRRRSIETAVSSMKNLGLDVKLIIYPGVGRGFDFRPPRVRTFADDLAAKDSNLRAANFIRAHLKKWLKK